MDVVYRLRAADRAGLWLGGDAVAFRPSPHGARGRGDGGGRAVGGGPGERGRLLPERRSLARWSSGRQRVRGTDADAPSTVDRVDVCALEPDARGYRFHNDGHNAYPAAVGDTALVVPVLVRHRLLAEPEDARSGAQGDGHGTAGGDGAAGRHRAYRDARPLLVADTAALAGLLCGGDGAARGGGQGQAGGQAPDGVLPVGSGGRGAGRGIQRPDSAGGVRYGPRVSPGDSACLPVLAGRRSLAPPEGPKRRRRTHSGRRAGGWRRCAPSVEVAPAGAGVGSGVAPGAGAGYGGARLGRGPGDFRLHLG